MDTCPGRLLAQKLSGGPGLGRGLGWGELVVGDTCLHIWGTYMKVWAVMGRESHPGTFIELLPRSVARSQSET